MTLDAELRTLIEAAAVMRQQTAALARSLSRVLTMAETLAQRIMTEHPERQPELMPLIDEIRLLGAKLAGALH